MDYCTGGCTSWRPCGSHMGRKQVLTASQAHAQAVEHLHVPRPTTVDFVSCLKEQDLAEAEFTGSFPLSQGNVPK